MKNRRGFTIVEVLIAIVMLTLGILALASSVGGITRMMSNGQRKTRSYATATSVMDSLRNQAKRSCSNLVAGTATYPGNIAEAWTVTNSGTANSTHVITLITTYRVGTRTLGDTLISSIYC